MSIDKKGWKRTQPREEKAKWLTTFNDLVTLLMVFFVLLFSMSTIDIGKMKYIANSLQSGLGVLKEGRQVSVVGKNPVVEQQLESVSASFVEETIEAINSVPGFEAIRTKGGVTIRLADAILFQSGKADINSDAFPILNKIIATLRKWPDVIHVEGHTDNVPIHTEKFLSNWDLSTSRAVNVVKYLVEEGKIMPQKLSAVGYGESKPLFPNDTPDHRARNRRVEIVLACKKAE